MSNVDADEVHIKEFLKILGKRGCPDTEKKLRKAFYGSIESGVLDIPDLFSNAVGAMEALRHVESKDQSKKSPEYQKFIKKINGLKKSLGNVLDYTKDGDIQTFFERRSQDEDEVPHDAALRHYKECFRRVRGLYIELEMFLHDPRKSVGRAGLSELYEFVYEVARLYELLSCKKFSVLPHKVSGQYISTTDSYRFVNAAMDWLHEQAVDLMGCSNKYTDKNIYNACDKARTRLNKERDSDK